MNGPMTMDELRTKIKKLRLEERRLDEPQALEVVLEAGQLPALTQILEGYFGCALKKPGERPSRELAKVADTYGGIRQNQSLYYRKDENSSSIAMIWPWSDGLLVTLKVYGTLK